jgi:hypothetical protein
MTPRTPFGGAPSMTFLSLFAGIGGFDLALARLGCAVSAKSNWTPPREASWPATSRRSHATPIAPRRPGLRRLALPGPVPGRTARRARRVTVGTVL